jgi:hypothetical protein
MHKENLKSKERGWEAKLCVRWECRDFGLRPSSNIPKSTEIWSLDLVQRSRLAFCNGIHTVGDSHPFT